jgi:hypothetical protein
MPTATGEVGAVRWVTTPEPSYIRTSSREANMVHASRHPNMVVESRRREYGEAVEVLVPSG